MTQLTTMAAQPTLDRGALASGPARASSWRRLRRVAVGALALCLIPVATSYVQALSAPSNAGLGIRSVEWLRDHGAAGVVSQVEAIYYTLTAPSTGGPSLRSLPVAGVGAGPSGRSASVRRARRVLYRPPRVRLAIHPALPGEGVWRGTGAHQGAFPRVLLSTFRADPAYPRLVAGVAWIDHTRTSLALYPGRQEPPGSLPRGTMSLPISRRHRLLASFNSGFKLQDARGGFAVAGHTYAPMSSGIATLVRYRTGRIDVTAWTGAAEVGPNVDFARQNLPLIVDHGHPNPNLSDGPVWGATLGNAVRVWRSGVGVDRHGNLLYAAAPDQTVGSLADVLLRAGAMRAMELDINNYWVSFISYAGRHAQGPFNLLSAMVRPPTRYLTPDDRDFFAVYARPTSALG